MSRYRSNRAGLSGIIKDSKRGNRATYAARQAAADTSGGVQSVESAATVTKWIRLEGPVTGQETTPNSGIIPTAIGLGIVTDAMLVDMPEAMVKGRGVGAGTGSPGNLDAAALIAILALADGAGSGLDADLLDGLNSSAFQPVDADLTALAALATTGLLARTAANTYATRTLSTASATRITVADGDGVAGNPTIDLAELEEGSGGSFLKFTRDGYGRVSATSPVAAADVSALLDADLVALAALATNGLVARTGSATFATRTLTAPAAGITVTDGDGVAGNPTLALANDLAALEAMAGTGLVARTGASTYAQRTIVAGHAISVSFGDGITSNPTISVADGAGSTLDADTLDGFDSTAFPRKAEDAIITGAWRHNKSIGIGVAPQTDNASYDGLQSFAANFFGQSGSPVAYLGANMYVTTTSSLQRVMLGKAAHYILGSDGDHRWYTAASGAANSAILPSERMKLSEAGVLTVNGNTVWHAGNDGAGSGLDADLLDGASWASPLAIGSTTPSTGAFSYAESSTVLKAAGSVSYLPSSQGAHLSWNRLGGGGRTDFINHKGGGAGGFDWWNGDGTTQTLVFQIDSNGNPNVKTSSIGAGMWFDGSATAQRVFFGMNTPPGDSIFRLYSAAAGANVIEVSLGSGDTVFRGALRSNGATAGIGYATGAGGSVTQATSKSTGVTLNKATGEITMHGAALAANTPVSFTLTNSAIAATDQIILTHHAGGTLGAYFAVGRCAAGSATITVRNIHTASLSEAIVLKFTVFKAVNA